MEDLKKAIMEFAESSKKTKFYFNDMEKAVKKVKKQVLIKETGRS